MFSSPLRNWVKAMFILFKTYDVQIRYVSKITDKKWIQVNIYQKVHSFQRKINTRYFQSTRF